MTYTTGVARSFGARLIWKLTMVAAAAGQGGLLVVSFLTSVAIGMAPTAGCSSTTCVAPPTTTTR